jgi:hypothetical protein
MQFPMVDAVIAKPFGLNALIERLLAHRQHKA